MNIATHTTQHSQHTTITNSRTSYFQTYQIVHHLDIDNLHLEASPDITQDYIDYYSYYPNNWSSHLKANLAVLILVCISTLLLMTLLI